MKLEIEVPDEVMRGTLQFVGKLEDGSWCTSTKEIVFNSAILKAVQDMAEKLGKECCEEELG